MKFLFTKDTWQEISRNITKNKFRTAFTMSGVIWGVFLLVLLLGLARGLENGFKKMYKNLSSNSFVMWSEFTEKPFKGYQKNRSIKIKNSDIRVLQKRLEGVQDIVPRIVVGNKNISNESVKGTFRIIADYPSFRLMQKYTMFYGRFLNQRDIKEFRKVIVISSKVYERFYKKNTNPIGTFLKIQNFSYKVVGVFKRIVDGIQTDIHIPFTTAQKLYNFGDIAHWFFVIGEKDSDIKKLQKDTELILKKIYSVHPDDEKAFGQFDVSKEFSKTTKFLKGIQFLTWFVGISTLIAGIFAISSILLITVKERTKEIGIRRAIGATPWMIKRQIILESVVLTFFSGIFGIIIGGLILMLVDSQLEEGVLLGNTDTLVNPSVSIPIVFAAVLLLVIFGTIIGFIPASRALKIKPIEAISEE